MIKKILFILLATILLKPTIGSADEYYVFIDNGVGLKESEKRQPGQGERGDVVEIAPFTPQYKPTKAEMDRYQVIVVNLTDEERRSLLEKDIDDRT